ncbi:cbb3-type cytochrome oxidase assembly protein CcoS [Oceanisphaera pacifica]|uniref:Cbb3-type cytochrome oxidase assembly protein CcoS n=1 Tax=Oceanisphaera pacifica TaxID=2818389 RepID=A0ABS3NFU7_9GAMM|nr:cbb3-type cytochrome oxidase assembly protein CcoS [Oceanisphaera pacifica]MBO1519454.1 cbb3-type cytochrome oxidase assembly protein CcoS [Oceanisphaera pacifica]
MTDNVDVWYFMIPIAMVFVGLALVLFFWSVKSDQFEDLDRHGSSILFDDDKSSHQEAQTHPEQKAASQLSQNKDDHDHSA